MRELKFRAWDVESECYIDEKDWAGITPEGQNIWIVEEEEVSVLPILGEFDIEQYTGLKDKNGKEIYEGDILESTWNGDKAVVVWNDVEGEWEHYADFNTHSKYSGSVVIGNIHENQELLEEEE